MASLQLRLCQGTPSPCHHVPPEWWGLHNFALPSIPEPVEIQCMSHQKSMGADSFSCRRSLTGDIPFTQAEPPGMSLSTLLRDFFLSDPFFSRMAYNKPLKYSILRTIPHVIRSIQPLVQVWLSKRALSCEVSTKTTQWVASFVNSSPPCLFS
jgi:hypothetical protein